MQKTHLTLADQRRVFETLLAVYAERQRQREHCWCCNRALNQNECPECDEYWDQSGRNLYPAGTLDTSDQPLDIDEIELVGAEWQEEEIPAPAFAVA